MTHVDLIEKLLKSVHDSCHDSLLIGSCRYNPGERDKTKAQL